MLCVTKSCPRVTHDVRSSPRLHRENAHPPRSSSPFPSSRPPRRLVLLSLPQQPSTSPAAPSPSRSPPWHWRERTRTRTGTGTSFGAVAFVASIACYLNGQIVDWSLTPGADRTGRGGFCVVFSVVCLWQCSLQGVRACVHTCFKCECMVSSQGHNRVYEISPCYRALQCKR
jgi:hypothetical protein